MPKTITVRGEGKLTVSPDTAEITMILRSKNKDYEKSTESAEKQLASVTEALIGAGLGRDALKTDSFGINSEYESESDGKGGYHSVFTGYVCVQNAHVELPLDTGLLSSVLSAVSGSSAEPEISVRFTVKDKTAVSEAVLREVAVNARRRAEVIADASGVKLRSLLSVEYGAKTPALYSPTSFDAENRCMALGSAPKMNFNPDEITVSDSATFVWEID